MRNFICLLSAVLFTSLSIAQISQGGLPYSFENEELLRTPQKYDFEKPDLDFVLQDDIERDAFKYPPRDAVIVPIGLSMNKAGTWTEMDNGDRIWRLELTVPDALALELFYEDFYLPNGAELYLYNPDYSEILGAYTSINNKPRSRFSSDAISGETTILEYFEPKSVKGLGSLTIVDLGYTYRSLGAGGGSQPCEVDVACPEGDEWENEINATVRIRPRINGNLFWCSGTLVNNTEQDCKPYILTALHCALNGSQSTTADYDNYRFYFEFQTPNCGSGNASAASSITGCDLRADSNDDGGNSGSDFMLLELQENVPENYEPFWAGWTSSSSALSGGGVCIHHPNADSKKISTFSNTPQSAAWGTSNTHWRVFWVETVTDWGVTEGGSSGSAIFNSDHHIMGTLTGGASFCEGINPPNGPDDPDLFGKMQRHFVSNPNSAAEKLKVWLDPLDIGSVTFDGSANPCGNVSVQEVEASKVFSLFPNPSEGIIRIQAVNNEIKIEAIEIIDISGKAVFNEQITNTIQELDLSELNSGMYMATVITEDGRIFAQRLILN
ncbi:MAG: T9SS type A sorting domain-containing protein [Bacteroidota bacterium]